MRKLATIVGLVLGFLAPTQAFSQAEPLSASESAALDAVIDPVLASISGTSTDQAVSDFFATSKRGIDPEQLELIAGKLDEAIQKYGPSQRCIMFEEQLRSSLVVQRKYACQHRDLISHWNFMLLRLPDGWAAQKLSFSTDAEELF